VVHARELDGRTLTFSHSGWLWHNAFLLYDHQTDSLWHHATGIAMSGPLRGRRLRRIPTTAIMTYGAWCAEHPATLVLAKPLDPKRPVETDLYAERDRRLELGFALELPGAARFYPFHAMGRLDALEDEFGGRSVVVVRDAAARFALAFDRSVGGSVLSFDVERGERPVLRERGGRRAWYLRSGAPVPGSGADTALVPLPGTPFESQAWELQHPDGSIHGAGPPAEPPPFPERRRER